MTSKNKDLSTVQPLVDIAAEENKLFRDGYVKGIAEFIKECATPTTIAIQGDWGTGKTSLINQIEKELRAGAKSAKNDNEDAKKYCKEIINVASFDVWKHYAANPHVDLPAELLEEIASKLSGANLMELGKVAEFVSSVSEVLGVVFGEEDDKKDDSSFGSILGMIFGSEDKSKSSKSGEKDETASSEDVSSFQTMFVEALDQCAKANGKSKDSRFVVIIDGLDYISPEITFDLMGLIKTYIDCPRCVIVFAVDKETVFSGVRKKLGDRIDEGQQKRHFDRLVQVPLRIPTSACDLDEYVKYLLKDNKELSGQLVGVIGTLLSEPTPRRIKRYINTMYLYRSIFGESESAGDASLAMLLAAVILEMESAKGFDVVARCAQGDEAQFDESLKAALDSLGTSDGINWAMLPTLWQGGESADVDGAKRSAFISWARKLK